ncbi:alpha/beta fold hydrolase [Draconibacterium mangrovi]|uniref:alpha/beta fold hydrolase n=1 Tax=Draconibacterium mangrovi TaxID=2697469 RepID=UPI0013D535B7|nr:alpha/beta hydrolase [Draconibacterium mangrovi]
MLKRLLYFVLLGFIAGCSNPGGELLFIEPKETDAFQYPYFLFIPKGVSTDEKAFVLIEPNNSGFADDDLQNHIEKAKRTSTKDFYLGNYAARKLNCPLLVPVFPRSKTNWKIYTHALDRDVMLQEEQPLKRIDLQLIEMYKHAQNLLTDKGIPSHDQFLLCGFSASATFANRFTLLHPDRVRAVAAGGLNGLLMLPENSLDEEMLNYPIGTNDMKELTGSAFQKETFIKTPQFYFMGQLDDNDAVPYDDAFSQAEREQIFKLLGEQMLSERWKTCSRLYKDAGVNADIRLYENIGHEHPQEVKDDVVAFFNAILK